MLMLKGAELKGKGLIGQRRWCVLGVAKRGVAWRKILIGGASGSAQHWGAWLSGGRGL